MQARNILTNLSPNPDKETNRYSECYKKVLYAGPKHFDKLKPEPRPTRNVRPSLQLCHSHRLSPTPCDNLC